MNPSVGSIIDEKYDLLEVLGSGATGIVYRARHRELDKIVALKLLLPDLWRSKDAQLRFKREAKILASLDSRNVVRIFDTGLLQGRFPFIIMEYLQGRSLKDHLLQHGAFSWQRAFEIGIEVCNGLTAIHSLSVVHRDLSPANVLIAKEQDHSETIKIIDLGLAALRGGSVAQLTETGALLGSLHYMSPEVCAGRDASPVSDIYALGCILYELISGQHAIDGPNAPSIIYRHTAVNPPSLRIAAADSTTPGDSIPEFVDSIIATAMNKRPSRETRENICSCCLMRASES